MRMASDTCAALRALGGVIGWASARPGPLDDALRKAIEEAASVPFYEPIRLMRGSESVRLLGCKPRFPSWACVGDLLVLQRTF